MKTMNCHSNESMNVTDVKGLNIDKLHVSLVIDGTEFNRSLTDDLQIDEDNLNVWLRDLPSKTAYWGIWRARARLTKLAAEYKKEEVWSACKNKARSTLYEELRKQYERYGALDRSVRASMPKPKDPTESDIKDLAMTFPEYKEAVNRYLMACEVDDIMDAALEGFKVCHSALITLAANLRQEFGSYRNVVKRPEDKFREDNILKDAAKNAQNYAKNTLKSKVEQQPLVLPAIPAKNVEKGDLELPVMPNNNDEDDIPF